MLQKIPMGFHFYITVIAQLVGALKFGTLWLISMLLHSLGYWRGGQHQFVLQSLEIKYMEYSWCFHNCFILHCIWTWYQWYSWIEQRVCYIFLHLVSQVLPVFKSISDSWNLHYHYPKDGMLQSTFIYKYLCIHLCMNSDGH